MEPKQYSELASKVRSLEFQMLTMDAKLDRLLTIFERGSGAWLLLRWLGAVVVGCAAIWAAIADHLPHWR